ncbi:TonB-dependent receptor [Capnocytophaga sp. oral taxon 332 str. F0381]|uniref:TonB-dependent receptor plug domain-containing protein n=1 Tax=Capnocytophaga sp. oral taxon 332 TaxID=712213 RepID=UPI0002A35FE6|nr:TonB-dependent receptor [Capnocytophaga sp. oral taxon 332]EKY10970.1 TonB-dependent receptor [Capnocytophaga sp. oral taxon 332 str. F0381]
MKRLVFAIVLLSAAAQAQEKVKDSVAERHYDLQEVTIFGKQNGKVELVPTQKLQASTLQNNNKTNVVDALNLLPGVSITQFGGRNEGTIFVRGFDNKRTPVYYDGIPIYAPYDGNFDLSRFLTYDLGSVSVEKGLVSVKYGANAMGGAVNIVSRSPQKELDINGTSGVGFADGAGVNSYFTGLNVGTRQNKYYAMVSGSFNKRENFVLSKNFEPTAYQDAGKRRNSGAFDKKLSAKFGYTPNETDEYALGFVNQQANKDISPGVDRVGNGSWALYPVYNKTSLYAKTKTKIARETFLNFTGYYDKYYNEMRRYDDETYTTINRPKTSFISIYDDYSAGGILTFSTKALNRNAITFTVNEKYDHHKEHNAEIAANPAIGQTFRAGEPEQSYKDNTLYAGIEDVITLTDWLDAVVGASYNQRKNILAQEYGTHYLTGARNVLYDFPTGNDSAFDFKGGLVFKPAENQNITLSASKRSRFASQKERYSSRFGGQVPNPDLKSEYSIAYDLTYTGKVLDNKLQYEVSGFINDVTNAIYELTVGVDSSGRNIIYNTNLGKALYQGFEAGVGYAPIKYFSFGANYSFIEMKDQTQNSNLKLTNVPKYKLVGFATISIPEIRTKLHLNTETYGKRYLNSQGDEAPDFTLVNTKLNVTLYKGLEFNFGVNNLLDRNYYWASGWPQAGRNFISGLSYNF